MLLILLIHYLSLVVYGSLTDFQTRFLLDHLETLAQKPNGLIGYFCTKTDVLKFTKVMTENGYLVAHFTNRIQVPEYILLHKILYVIDYGCKMSRDILHVANKTQKFKLPNEWITFIPKNLNNKFSLENLEVDFLNLSILSDSSFTVIHQINKTSFKLSKMYKNRIHAPWLLEQAVWAENLKKNRSANVVPRRNLNGTILKSCLVITNNDSLNHLTDRRDAHIDTIAKVNYVLVKHLGDILNVSLKYSVQGTWGYKDKNSQWTGMIGELVRQESDIGGTPLFLTSDRVKIIDYLAMTTPTGSKFVFLQPKLSYVTNVFALPFHYSIWLSVTALLIICGFALTAVIRWEKSSFGIVVTHYRLEVVFLELSAFCQQGISFIPESLSGKTLAFLLLISMMFLYNSYSANIVALLQSSSNNIQTLSDLLRSRLAVGVDDTVYNRFYFPNETEPVRRALYLQKVAPPGQPPRYFPMLEGVKKIREGLFAFHMETGVGYRLVAEYFQEHEKCDLYEIEFLLARNPWLAVQKNSSFKEAIKIGLRTLAETGLQKREVSLLYIQKPQCISRGSGFISVGLIDTYFAFVVLMTGISTSIFLFLMEKTYSHIYSISRVKLNKKLKQKVAKSLNPKDDERNC